MTWRSALNLHDRQAQVRRLLGALLAGVSDEVAAHPPVPGSRSIAEVLAHMILTERRIGDDIRLMLAHEHPELPSIALLDEPARLRTIVAGAGSLAGLLDAFDAACQATLDLVQMLTEAQELRTGHSRELGNVQAGCHATINVRYHYPAHLAEIRLIRRQLGLPESEAADSASLPSSFLA